MTRVSTLPWVVAGLACCARKTIYFIISPTLLLQGVEAMQSSFIPFEKIRERVSVARQESDTAFFFHLLYFGEMLLKLATVGLVAAIADDRERHRYRQLYRLVRADGLGEWSASLEDVLTGPAAQFLAPAARAERRDLTQRSTEGTWQYDSVALLWRCLREIEADREQLPGKVDGLRWFVLFSELRNKTRAHGAPHGATCSRLSPALERSINLVVDNFSLFRRSWAYVHRNLSRKYRVTRLSQDSAPFDSLRSDGSQNFESGVYVNFDSRCRVELLWSDPDASDFSFPNGGFSGKRFEIISYITDNRSKMDAGPYLVPATELPKSETHGMGNLEIQGKCFGNLPAVPASYIQRETLEKELLRRITDDHHPVVTVRGAGGIGKTSLATTVLHRVADQDRFGAIIWFSARDIDLLPEGPKDVKPQVLTEEEIAKEFCRLICPANLALPDFKPTRYFAEALTRSPIGDPILFVFDNFETVRSPSGLYEWIDTYVRNPNKVFITTRFSDFRGDFPVDVYGMTEVEAENLIGQTAYSLGVQRLLSSEYRKDLYRESDGHPYVIKIMLGEVAKAGRPQKVERIVSGRADILDALFERTYSGLTPAARLVFMTLSSWRSTVPQVAVEAVMLRPQNEKFDIDAALEELKRSSLVEERTSEDGSVFLTVPLVAAVFGKQKLSVSAEKSIVETSGEMLRLLGAAQRTDIRHGIGPRIGAMFTQIADRVNRNAEKLDEYLPVMEFLSYRYAPGWLLLARIFEESAIENALERAKDAVRHYLELTRDPEAKRRAWRQLAEYCRRSEDWIGEVHALVEMAELPGTTFEDVSNTANRLNGLFATHQFLESSERNLLVARLTRIMDGRISEGNATDCSRLAWLYSRLGDTEKVRSLVERGLAQEPQNDHCLRIQEKFGRA